MARTFEQEVDCICKVLTHMKNEIGRLHQKEANARIQGEIIEEQADLIHALDRVIARHRANEQDQRR